MPRIYTRWDQPGPVPYVQNKPVNALPQVDALPPASHASTPQGGEKSKMFASTGCVGHEESSAPSPSCCVGPVPQSPHIAFVAFADSRLQVAPCPQDLWDEAQVDAMV